MVGSRFGVGWHIRTALLVVVLAACSGDPAPTAPVRNEMASVRQALAAATTVGCDTICVVLQNTLPFRAARVQPDSATSQVLLASFRISGQANGVVRLHLVADTTWWSAVPDTAVLEVVADSVRSVVPLSALKTESVVYRFTSSKVVALRLELRRQFPALPAGSVQLVQHLQHGQLLQATTPWGPRPVSAATTTSSYNACGFNAPETTCGVTIGINPFWQGTAWTSTGFQSGSGTGASSTIHLTFSQPVDGFSVNVYDPDYNGNKVVAYDATGKVIGRVNVPGDRTPGVLTIEPVTITAPGIVAVDLIPASGDYVAYDNAQLLAAILTVACTPSPVVRGSSVTCTATPPQGSTSTTINQWQFANNQFTIVNTTNHALTWSGVVAVGGTVTVNGLVDGNAATGSTTFTVSRRDWTQDTVSLLLINVQPSGLPSQPKAYSDLGQTFWSAIIDPSNSVYTIIQGGPNDSVAYFLKPPVAETTLVHVNSEQLGDTSSQFTQLQPISSTTDTCTRADVLPYLPLVQAHEGIPPNPSSTASHSGVFRYQLNVLIPPVAESLKALGADALFTQQAMPVLQPLIDSAQKLARDSANGGTVPPISYHCRFRFFPN